METTLSELDELLDSTIGTEELPRYAYWTSNGVSQDAVLHAAEEEADGLYLKAEETLVEQQRQVAVADAVMILASKGQLTLRSVLGGVLNDRIGAISSAMADETSSELLQAGLRTLRAHHQSAAMALEKNTPALRLARLELSKVFNQFDTSYKNRTTIP